MATPDLSKLKINRDTVTRSHRPRGSRRALSILALALVAALAWWSFSGMLRETAVEVVNVTTAYPSQALTLLNATGYVVAQRKAAVASKATGRLEWLGVAEGSQVKKGAIIARLESLDVQAAEQQAAAQVRVAVANLGQAKAELGDAQAAYQRAQELVAKSFIAQSALDTAAARSQKAKAAVASGAAAIAAAQANQRAAQVAVEQTLVRAPFDGVVLTKAANVGDVITPFSSASDSKGAVVTMADMATLEVEADVSESNISKVRLNQPCEIQLDAIPEQRFAGRLARMVPTMDRSKASLTVKVQFVALDPRVLPEMSAKVAFLEREVTPQERQPVTVISPAAIATRAGRSVVFLFKEGKAVETAVRTGRKLGEFIEVSGVAAGDKAVLHPSEQLKHGTAIKPIQK